MSEEPVEGEEERQQSSEALGDGVTCSFDLLPHLDPNSIPLGFLGIAKYVNADGLMATRVIEQGIQFWEIDGLLKLLRMDLQDSGVEEALRQAYDEDED